MATPSEQLSELRERVAAMPQQVVDMIRSHPGLAPAPPEDDRARVPAVPSLADGPAGSGVDAAAPPAGPAFASTAPPVAPAFAASGTSSTPPAAPAFDGGGLGARPPAPPALDAATSGSGSLPASPEFAAPEPASARGALGDPEVVRLLSEIALKMGGGASGARPAAPLPSGPRQATWSSTWQAPAEGFAGGASPSMDVSNIAGAGGASSRRGYGTHQGGGRYLQPDPGDGGIPR